MSHYVSLYWEIIKKRTVKDLKAWYRAERRTSSSCAQNHLGCCIMMHVYMRGIWMHFNYAGSVCSSVPRCQREVKYRGRFNVLEKELLEEVCGLPALRSVVSVWVLRVNNKNGDKWCHWWWIWTWLVIVEMIRSLSSTALDCCAPSRAGISDISMIGHPSSTSSTYHRLPCFHLEGDIDIWSQDHQVPMPYNRHS